MFPFGSIVSTKKSSVHEGYPSFVRGLSFSIRQRYISYCHMSTVPNSIMKQHWLKSFSLMRDNEYSPLFRHPVSNGVLDRVLLQHFWYERWEQSV